MRVLRPLALLGLILAATPAAGAATAPAWDLATLMHALAAVRSASGSFAETKTMALLKTPLNASGTLRYVAPDYLSETVLAPAHEDFVLRNDTVVLTANGQTHRFNLAQAPQIAGLVEGVRATLAGDEAALQQDYAVALSGGPDGWQLLLRPKDPAVKGLLSWLSIRGSGARVTEIETGGTRGDLTRMTVQEATTDAP